MWNAENIATLVMLSIFAITCMLMFSIGLERSFKIADAAAKKAKPRGEAPAGASGNGHQSGDITVVGDEAGAHRPQARHS